MDDSKEKYNSNVVVVNSKSSFKSHLVKCQTIMDNINFDHLVLKGLGRATSRTINLANQLNSNNFNTFEIVTRKYSIDLNDEPKKLTKLNDMNVIGDEFDPEENTVRTLNRVPAIEIIVRKNKLEISHFKKQQKTFDNPQSISIGMINSGS